MQGNEIKMFTSFTYLLHNPQYNQSHSQTVQLNSYTCQQYRVELLLSTYIELPALALALVTLVPSYLIAFVCRAGLTIVPVVPCEALPRHKGPRSTTAKFLPCCFDVWTYLQEPQVSWLKRNDDFWGTKCVPPEKILATHMRKGPPPYVGMGLLKCLIRPCLWHWCASSVMSAISKLLIHSNYVSLQAPSQDRTFLVMLRPGLCLKLLFYVVLLRPILL